MLGFSVRSLTELGMFSYPPSHVMIAGAKSSCHFVNIVSQYHCTTYGRVHFSRLALAASPSCHGPREQNVDYEQNLHAQ